MTKFATFAEMKCSVTLQNYSIITTMVRSVSYIVEIVRFSNITEMVKLSNMTEMVRCSDRTEMVRFNIILLNFSNRRSAYYLSHILFRRVVWEV